jgi:peptidoglycan/xylan/chitin deacetylase (PgdA/CDA1 family)
VNRSEQDPAVAVNGVDRWRLPILRYRSVLHHGPETVVPGSVPVVRLEEHLSFLVTAGFRVLGLSDALRALREDGTRRVVALTFDDALLDFLDAFDLLGIFGARATLYVPTGTVGTRVSRWGRGQPRLDWYYLQEIAAAGIELGSQSASFRFLDGRPDTAVQTEARGSRHELEDHLGVRVESFCFATGHPSTRMRRAVEAAGYHNACGVVPRVAHSRDDAFGLPRLPVRPSATGPRIDGLLRSGGGTAVPAWRIAEPACRAAQRTTTWIARNVRCVTRRPSSP